MAAWQPVPIGLAQADRWIKTGGLAAWTCATAKQLWHAGGGDGGHAAVRVLVGVLLYLDLRARTESLTLEAVRADLQASAA